MKKKSSRLTVLIVLLSCLASLTLTGCATVPPQLQSAEPEAADSADSEEEAEDEDGVG
jgi:starvation-inducible outer membrane lipoprotein